MSPPRGCDFRTDRGLHRRAGYCPHASCISPRAGARAEFIPLGDRGIQGNGHMMMMESNSDQLAAGIAAWLQTGKFSASAS
ncbi:MAG: hypothetical protein BGO74_06365 [Burkholderiales bacterium 68-12]|nr:MAG: hypothetical protein BGO74_06365 [Burkholderiales bacterium 68-12]